MRAPERSFNEGWPRGLNAKELAPYYEKAERMLGATPMPMGTKLAKTDAYQSVAEAMGAHSFRPNLAVYFGDGPAPAAGEIPVAVRDPHGLGVDVLQEPCRMCGECDIDCRFGAKNTTDKNYLAVATQKYGAVVQPLSEVIRIAPKDGGYSVHYRDRKTRAVHHCWAPTVVIAAGTVNTSELLLRCRDQQGSLPGLSPALGNHFSGNGDFLAATLNTREELNPWHGPTITLAISRTEGKQHYYLEEGGFAPDLAFFVGAVKPRSEYVRKFMRGPFGFATRRQWFYKEVARATGDNDALRDQLPSHTMIFLGMGEDGSDGQVRLRRFPGRKPRLDIKWKHDATRPLINAMEKDLKRISAELGGEYVSNPLWSVLGRLITVHPLGGAAMSDDISQGVVNPMGEVWGYPGLYVADGSVIPRAIGPNPSLTITAVAERTAAHIIKSS
jgi:cholesterol oxidase